ncbi:UDP-N-acetylmuramate dehydrogenase [Corynebacterium flavescens]
MLEEFLTQQLAAVEGITLDYDTDFASLTTLRVGGKPQVLVRCSNPEAAVAATQLVDDASVPLVIVGGGSNLLVRDGAVDVVALLLEFGDINVDAGSGLVRAEAGAEWDRVVAASVDAGLGGIECLSGIPGSAGAVPVQNVGAYGAEISDVLTRVRLYDRQSHVDEWVPAADLDLDYRYSNLKFTHRAVVLEIELQLSTDGLSKPLRFGQLTQQPGERRRVAEVREEVLRLRHGKGMVLDPQDHDTWSAGSFFTNPIVDPALAEAVCARVRTTHGDTVAETMPRHAVAKGEKLSAAWLIEKAGFPKGYPGQGRATLSTKHTLALSNRGEARAEDIVALARDIRDGVRAAFGVELVPEPVWLGLAL